MHECQRGVVDVLSRFRIAGPIEERRYFALEFVRSADSERRGEEKAAESSAHAAVREPLAQAALLLLEEKAMTTITTPSAVSLVIAPAPKMTAAKKC